MADVNPSATAKAAKPMRKLDDLLDSRLMAKLDGIDVMSRKIFAGKLQGERRSRRRGQSVEFADYRPYTPGDDLRFVDWNIYGRLDRLFLKMFLEEEDLSLVIAIDASASSASLRVDIGMMMSSPGFFLASASSCLSSSAFSAAASFSCAMALSATCISLIAFCTFLVSF